MTTLQDIMGLITKRKIKTPKDNDYIISAAYIDTQERLKPQPKMEASLLSIGAIKNYILSSVTPPTPPTYKVYTALLTQTGGNSIVEFTEGNTVIGVTYEIFEDTPTAEGFDFTNVGAPNNNLGTFFVATGTTPNSWGNNNVRLRYNEGAPVVTVLENTIGNIWFEYDNVGTYKCSSDSLFTLNKTTVFINDTVNDKGNYTPLKTRVLCSNDAVAQPVYLFIYTGAVDGTLEDSIISQAGSTQYAVTLEIRVYN